MLVILHSKCNHCVSSVGQLSVLAQCVSQCVNSVISVLVSVLAQFVSVIAQCA